MSDAGSRHTPVSKLDPIRFQIHHDPATGPTLSNLPGALNGPDILKYGPRWRAGAGLRRGGRVSQAPPQRVAHVYLAERLGQTQIDPVRDEWNSRLVVLQRVSVAEKIVLEQALAVVARDDDGGRRWKVRADRFQQPPDGGVHVRDTVQVHLANLPLAARTNVLLWDHRVIQNWHHVLVPVREMRVFEVDVQKERTGVGPLREERVHAALDDPERNGEARGRRHQRVAFVARHGGVEKDVRAPRAHHHRLASEGFILAGEVRDLVAIRLEVVDEARAAAQVRQRSREEVMPGLDREPVV